MTVALFLSARIFIIIIIIVVHHHTNITARTDRCLCVSLHDEWHCHETPTFLLLIEKRGPHLRFIPFSNEQIKPHIFSVRLVTDECGLLPESILSILFSMTECH